MEQGAVLSETKVTVGAQTRLRPVTEREWRTVYGSLGLSVHFEAFMKTPGWKPCVDEDDDRVSIPVVGQLSLDLLAVAHRSLGIRVVVIDPPGLRRAVWSAIPSVHARGVQRRPYQVNMNRSFDADNDLWGKSAERLKEMRVMPCDIIEYSLFSLLLHMRGDCEDRLDDGLTGTLCAGTRRGDFVPIASYCSLRKQLQIAWIHIQSSPANFGAREVFMPV